MFSAVTTIPPIFVPPTCDQGFEVFRLCGSHDEYVLHRDDREEACNEAKRCSSEDPDHSYLVFDKGRQVTIAAACDGEVQPIE